MRLARVRSLGALVVAASLLGSLRVAPVAAVGPGPDLSITMTDGQIVATAGETVQYQIIVHNSGPIDATGVVVTEIVPANSTFNAGASAPGWVCAPSAAAGSACTYAVGALAAGGNWALYVDITLSSTFPAGVKVITNTASVTDDGTNGADPNPFNNSATDTDGVLALVVNSLADTVANDGDCTLREAIIAANTNTASGTAGGECAAGSSTASDTITFSVSGTITLATASLPFITSNLSIDGGGAITVDGANGNRPFAITSGNTVTLDGLTITKGRSPGFGGAIVNSGSLTLTHSTLDSNVAAMSGGGIYSDGTLTITDATISGNSTAGDGGGIENKGTLTVTSSTISGNSAAGDGGGTWNSGSATVANSTLVANHATNSGGGLYVDVLGVTDLRNVTITANSAALAGGIRDRGASIARNTVDAGNDAPLAPELAETGSIPINQPNDLFGVPSGKTLGDIFVVDGAGKPVLTDDGGPTKTVALALVAGNPAIDAGDSATCAAAPVSANDQRGSTRPSACDVGAYEAQPPTIAAHANVTGTPTSASGGVVTYTAPAGTNEQGGTATVACSPASGSTFPVGSTTVTCTATDAIGHTASTNFQVVLGAFVTAAPSIRPTMPSGTDTIGPATRSDAPGLPLVLAILGLLGVGALRPIRGRQRRQG